MSKKENNAKDTTLKLKVYNKAAISIITESFIISGITNIPEFELIDRPTIKGKGGVKITDNRTKK